MKKNSLSIATCQFDVGGDVDQNLHQMLRQIKTAGNKSVDVAHFPECCLTGYGGIQLQNIRRADYQQLPAAIEKIQQQASKFGLFVIFGSHYFIESADKPRNSLLVINPVGQIEARYDKRILTGAPGSMDKKYYSAGEDPVCFEIGGISCGLVICHEWRYAEFYREYKKLGVELIFHSWFDGGLNDQDYKKLGMEEGELIVGAVKGYAANNYLWVSGSNISSRQSCFSSFVAQPDGQIHSKAPRNKSHILISKIDLTRGFTDPSFYGRQRFLK